MTTIPGRASGARLVMLATLMGLYQLSVGVPGFASSDGAAAAMAPATQASKPGIDTNMICRTCDPPDPPPSPRPTPTPPPPPPPPSFTTLMSRYTPYDINGDGRLEINSLKPLFPNPEPYYATPNGVVIVLVDPKLVTDEPNIQMSRFEMSLWLSLLGNDISSDGFFPYFVEASVYAGTAHQDGRTVLALRRFLKEVKSYYPVAGVLLVGSFPDAGIVRHVFVKAERGTDNPISFTSGAEPVMNYSGHFLGHGAEYITTRAEIVLGDLDGNWEAVYREAPFTVTNYQALPYESSASYPVNGQIIETPRYDATIIQTFEDVFYIQDHEVSTWTDSGWLRLIINSVDEPSPEVSAADRLRPNRIARPEILVSRIDPLRVALRPTAPLDLDGKSPLDASGRPQKLRYNSWTGISWQRDRSLERRLVADYVARSHRFRLGYDNDKPFRTSAIRALDSGLVSPTSFNNLLRKASSSFEPSTGVDNATLFDYVLWLREPAVLKGIAAHSNARISQFGPSEPFALELATGGGSHVWRWVGQQEGPYWVLEPSFEGLSQDAEFHIYRTMWESGILDDVGAGQAFVVHEGCEVIRPAWAEYIPYNHPAYGSMANGESLMFYANGLGMMARNKVFNDMPVGFYDGVKSSGGRFGFGWRTYFVTEADNTGLDERALDPTVVSDGGDRRWRTLQRKRSYFWSTIGDFTLKIRY